MQLTLAGTRWRVTTDFAPLLEAVLNAPPHLIKESAPKLVTRHEVNGRAYYVKRYRHAAFLFRPVKFLLKPSQAAQEWWLAGECEARGVPIVRHVALGERWSVRGLLESVLVTEAFDGVPVSAEHAAHFRAVVDFVGALARSGVTHHDFHPANLLIKESTGELRLIDLHGARISGAEADPGGRDLMLAQLCMTLSLPVADEVFQAAHALRLRAFASRSKRCLKTNRDFARKKAGKLRWQVRREALTPEVEAVLRDPDAFLARSRVLKAGRSSTVGAADGLVLKRYNFRRWLRPFKDIFRESRARAAFRKSYHLELSQILTPRVFAAADERVFGLVRRGFVLMEEVRAATDLATVPGDLRARARAAGRLVGSLHRSGFRHRDLKETNILFNRDGVPGFIDLEGLQFVSGVGPGTSAQDLGRLAEGAASCGRLNRPTFLAFMLAYRRERGVPLRLIFPRA